MRKAGFALAIFHALCRSFTAAVTAFAVAGLTACARPAQQPPALSAALTTETYVIGPGDHLAVFIYDNPQLSTDVAVRPDGRVSMPLIPDMPAAGRTPPQLAQDISDRISKYVKSPNVAVMVREFVGTFDKQIRVIGEAADPQAIPYREHMTLLDVLIQTKGLTRFASGNHAVLVRQLPTGGHTSYQVHLADLMKDGDVSQNVELQPGDTLVIPQSWF